MRNMRLFAKDTVNSKNYEAEAILELPTKKGAPFFFKIFQTLPKSEELSSQAEGANVYLNCSTIYDNFNEKTLFTEYAFIPTEKGYFRTNLCGEEAKISWSKQNEDTFLFKDFYGNEALFSLSTWEVKEILTQDQINRSDLISRVQNKLKRYVDNNGFDSQDPTLINMLGTLCELHQRSWQD